MKRFLKYVEISTKITSVFAFTYALAFLIFIGRPVKWELTWVFFASMLLLDLASTAINNYCDKSENASLQFSRKTALLIIIILLAIGAGLGLYLVYRTDAVVLLAGALCFACGIFYTAGPIPISRQPLGEVMSGLFYGLFIPFILIYINLPIGTLLTLSFTRISTFLILENEAIIALLLLSVAPACTTANIMLANNICDLERDVAVKRYTLPYYMGKGAVTLFGMLYYAVYLSSIILVVFKILPPLYLLSLITFPFAVKNIRAFSKKQDKATTFVLSIKNYILIMGGNILAIILCRLVG